MRVARRGLLLAALVSLGLVAGWRITTIMLADAALARDDVAGALRWRADHPEALFRRAESDLAGKRLAAAEATARHLLKVAPIDGRGFRLLAQVADARGERGRALVLYRIAARRAPRDQPSHAWLIQSALMRGDTAEAVAHIDQLLTHSGSGAKLYEAVIQLSADPGFADGIAVLLAQSPEWRPAMLAALKRARGEDRIGADRLMGAMQRIGALDTADFDAWIESLLKDARWGEAHARWAAPMIADGISIPPLFNGDFARVPRGSGFDWRILVRPGVLVDVVPGQGDRQALQLSFLGTRVGGTFLEHPLLLSPGRWRLRYRLRADALRSDSGFAWSISCAEGKRIRLFESGPVAASDDWRSSEHEFTVPAQACTGQWLRFGNAGVPGKTGKPGKAPSSQWASGDLYLAAIGVSATPGAPVVERPSAGLAPRP